MIDVKTGEMAGRETAGKVEWKEMPCDGKECVYYKNEKCREVMNLQFLLPQVPGLGVWQIDTSSINSIRNINSSTELIRGIIGRIRMVPLILSLGKQEVTNPDDGKKKTVNVMSMRHNATLQNLIADSIKPIQQLLAPPPDDSTEPPLDVEPVTTEPNIEQAAKDVEELFPPDPKHAAEAAVKPAGKVWSFSLNSTNVEAVSRRIPVEAVLTMSNAALGFVVPIPTSPLPKIVIRVEPLVPN